MSFEHLGFASSATQPPRGLPASAAALAGALLFLSSCDGKPAQGRRFEEARIVEDTGARRWNATSAERFGFTRKTEAPESSRLSWTTPAGWEELPTSALREANFRIAGLEGGASGECYLTTLGGEGGGLEANANRWRSQMSQPPLSAQEIAALPRLPWLGGTAVFLDVEGTWTGMSGDAQGAQWRLAGLLLVDAAQSRFLKLVGPKELVARELEHFRELAASFKEAEHVHDHGESHAESDHASAPEPLAASSAYAWTAPPAWRRGPEKAMREVTFLSGERGEVECYVSELSGDGGGLLANLNRWREQLGEPPLSDSDLAALERVPMAGAEGVLIEIVPSSPTAQGALLGAVCVLPSVSLFVKLTGPRESVEREREAFRSFCRSLRPTRS